MKKQIQKDWADNLLWGIYIMLLLVLLPHTAWWFSKAEPETSTIILGIGIQSGKIIAWLAAITFELIILAMTHKLSLHIKVIPNYQNMWKRISERYFNRYSLGLTLGWIISSVANLSHSVEFARPMKMFGEGSLDLFWYSLASGAILPTASLIFAWVLSANPELKITEQEVNAELEVLKGKLRSSEREVRSLKARVNNEFADLQSDDKRAKVEFAKGRWPGLSQAGIAEITDTSPAWVSQVINSNGK